MSGALKTVLYLAFVLTEKMAQDPDPRPIEAKSRSVLANVGQSVTLECFYDEEKTSKVSWYRQLVGRRPILMTTFYLFNREVSFHGEFQYNPRFTMSSKNSKNSLMISNLESTDSATYFCGKSIGGMLEFMEGTTVLVQGPGAGFPVWVHQWASGGVQRGDSVTLQCRVETGSCAGGARVYWLRETSEAEAGILYAAGGSRQQQCMRNASVQTHTCFSTLPMSLDPSHTGIYYCAVASCGRILFGKGTKLDFGPETNSRLYFWSGVSAFTTPLSLLLALLMCVRNNNSPPYAGSLTVYTAESGDEVLYGASGTTKKPRCREDDTWSECVYLMVEP